MDDPRVAAAENEFGLCHRHGDRSGIPPDGRPLLPPEMIEPARKVDGCRLHQVGRAPAVIAEGRPVPMIVEEQAVPDRDPVGRENDQQKTDDAGDTPCSVSRWTGQA